MECIWKKEEERKSRKAKKPALEQGEEHGQIKVWEIRKGILEDLDNEELEVYKKKTKERGHDGGIHPRIGYKMGSCSRMRLKWEVRRNLATKTVWGYATDVFLTIIKMDCEQRVGLGMEEGEARRRVREGLLRERVRNAKKTLEKMRREGMKWKVREEKGTGEEEKVVLGWRKVFNWETGKEGEQRG